MIFEKICAVIGDIFPVDVDTLEMTTSFTEDLHADSLDLVEIVMAIEEEFEVEELDEAVVENIKTIGDAVNVIKELLGE
ncbi:MAG: acyl carrier protein [Clostridia bacterium]